MSAILKMLLVAAVALAACANAQEPPAYPFFASDKAGHLHINTTSPEQDVYVNGVSFKELVRDVQELKAVVGLDTDDDPKRGRITDVLDVHDGAAFLSAKNGIFLSSNRTHVVTEKTDAWDPSTVNALVGEFITFKWSSLEAVYQAQSDGSTAVQGGHSSGDAVIGGEFTVRLREAKTYKFRAANKGFVCTVNARTAGVKAGGRTLEPGSANGFHIVGFGEDYGSGCTNTFGALYGSGSSCYCREGERKEAFYEGGDRLYFCVVSY